MAYTVHCDVNKCKNKTDASQLYYGTPKGWNRISISCQGKANQQFHLCQDCSEKFGIEVAIVHPDYGQQLLDILYEIVQEEVANSREKIV